MKQVIALILLCTLVYACGLAKNKIRYKAMHEIDAALLNYTVNSKSIEDENLIIKVQYGGGAIRPHEFDLVEQSISKDSVNLVLLHLTQNDRARAIMRSELSYNIRYYLKKNLIISLNDQIIPSEN